MSIAIEILEKRIEEDNKKLEDLKYGSRILEEQFQSKCLELNNLRAVHDILRHRFDVLEKKHNNMVRCLATIESAVIAAK